MDWFEIENELGNIPSCIKTILNVSGYDCLASISELNEQKICELEQHITIHELNVIANLTCCHSEKYKKQQRFNFLPGHRATLRILPDAVEKILASRLRASGSQSHTAILNELIKTSNTNSKKNKNHAEYSDMIKDFFTYIYLLSGKHCYETLNANLPIPSTKTICRYI